MSACSMLDNPCYFAGIAPNKYDIVVEYLQICQEHPIKTRFIRQHVFGILKDEFAAEPEQRAQYCRISHCLTESINFIQQFKEYMENKTKLEESTKTEPEITTAETEVSSTKRAEDTKTTETEEVEVVG
eukprot:TRINITY_DN1278_c0_g1_i2.p2 TRINITY_DN1278_c0_g1~~TRINITY_DN1278_c0_g1_i2.p2  ORF type:complete len:129 (+),score=16.06 TRINITY_DN1278_c0_g1_i2:843-1229(+)